MLTAIVHCDSKGLIGTAGTLAYRSREDFQFFKKYTSGSKHGSNTKVLVMGTKTYKESGQLANRNILVLSSNGNLFNGKKTTHTVSSLKPLNLILCGGSKIYEEYLPFCKEVIVNYTKQIEKSPGLAPVFFNIEQLHNLFEVKKTEEFNTFTQVTYKAKCKIFKKYSSRSLIHILEELEVEECPGDYWLNINSKCKSGSDEYYLTEELWDTKSEALLEIQRLVLLEEIKLTQKKLALTKKLNLINQELNALNNFNN